MRQAFQVKLRDGGSLSVGERTLVVGVLNITPDSFSDGGRYFDRERAIDRALQMESEGADVIEVGGESTRPGSTRLPVGEELKRVLPVLSGLAGRLRVPTAIDTYKSETAEAALREGASIVNDVSALRFDPRIADVAAREGAALVLMHIRGEPETMQKIAPSTDIFAEIERDFARAIAEAEIRGVARTRLILDPGIGFGKTLEQNLEIINHLDRFAHFGLPMMVGTSRKSFIARITGRPEADRAFGAAASVALAIARGAHLVRVHDVREMVEVARIADAILASDSGLA